MRTSEWTLRAVALVEALHPAGAADGAGDLVLVEGDPDRAAAHAAVALAPDGIAWVSVRPGRRRAARAALRRAGLVVRGAWLVVPVATPRRLVRLEAAGGGADAVAAAIHPLLATRAGRGAVAIAARAARVLEELWPQVGLLAQRSEAQPPLSWLGEPRIAVVAAGWHAPEEGLVLIDRRQVVKTTRSGGRRDPRHEAAVLRSLGPAAVAAGAAVPRVLGVIDSPRRVAVRETALDGSPAAAVLRWRPRRLADVTEQLARWLVGWHGLTRFSRPLAASDLERLVYAPAARVAALVPHGDAYVASLRELGDAVVDRTAALAAVHNDLTTWNVLLRPRGLAVLDWEHAAADGLPLVDLEYAIVDAVAAARRCRRDVAFARCTSGGADGVLARRLWDTSCARLELDPQLAELARHACWLGHASNEAEKAPRERPFLAIVARLAAQAA